MNIGGCYSPKSIVGLVHPKFPVNQCKKTNKIAQYAAFITFIICKCRKPKAILAYFYFVITYSLGDMIWRTILCLLSDNKPYITDLWIIIPLGRARILSYNLDNSLLDLLLWWRIWTRRPRPREQRRCVIAPSASARHIFCFSPSAIHEEAHEII